MSSSSTSNFQYASDSHGVNPMIYQTTAFPSSKNPAASKYQPAYNSTSRKGYDIENGEGVFHSSEEISFSKFVSQTLNYVSLQLLSTMFVSISMYMHKQHVIDLINSNSGYFWLPIIFTFISLAGLHCSGKNSWSQLTWFWCFTISFSFVVGVSVLTYSPNIVLKAVITTGLIVMGVNAYCHYAASKGIDLSFLGPILMTCLFALIIIGILNIFIKSDLVGLLICFFGVLVFTGLLLFDLDRLYHKNKNNGEYMESPMVAAVEIYLDIINLFLYLMEMYKRCDDGGSN